MRWGGSDVCPSVESGVRSLGAGAEESLKLSLAAATAAAWPSPRSEPQRGPWPPSSGGGRAPGARAPRPGGFFFVVPLPPAREPVRPPNKGTSRRRGRRRSRSLSLGPAGRAARRPISPPGLPVLGGSRGGDPGRAGLGAGLRRRGR